VTAGERWVLERWVGGGRLLHGRPVPVDGRRRLSLLEVTSPTVVLGSTSAEVIVPGAWGGERVETCRRRSGGGLVWLEPGNSTWLDVFVPADDPLAERDVARAFLWLGDALAVAAVGLGVDARVHRGRHRPGPDGGLVCFEGVGSGEVVVDDRKLVGISQRRTRAGARFQCVWYRHWTVGALAEVVGPAATSRMATAGVGVEDLVGDGASTALLEAVLAVLAAR
jgi:lipoate-protein ligase A